LNNFIIEGKTGVSRLGESALYIKKYYKILSRRYAIIILFDKIDDGTRPQTACARSGRSTIDKRLLNQN